MSISSSATAITTLTPHSGADSPFPWPKVQNFIFFLANFAVISCKTTVQGTRIHQKILFLTRGFFRISAKTSVFY